MNTFTFSDEAQILTVYNFSQDSQEYIGESDAYIAPNTGLPNYCTLISPPEKVPGFTPVWENETWRLIEDHRGQTVYNKVDGSQLIIQELGNDSNLLIVFYVQIMPDDFVMQLHRF